MNRPKAGIKVSAPATISHLVAGYGLMGMALEAPYDEIIAKPCDTPGVHIASVTGQKHEDYRKPAKNPAANAARSLLEALGKADTFGVELHIHKRVPYGMGLGSRAAAAVAGAMAVNELLRRPVEKRQLLPFALAGLQASGNFDFPLCHLAPALWGGIAFVRDAEKMDIQRIPAARGMHAAIATVPKNTIPKTSAPNSLPLPQHVKEGANLGGFLVGLYHIDFDAIRKSLQGGCLAEDLIPEKMTSAKTAATENGALGCGISGSSATIAALTQNSVIAESVSAAMQAALTKEGLKPKSIVSGINHEGAKRF